MSAGFAAMHRHVPDDAVIAVDVGDNTYSFGRYFECRRQKDELEDALARALAHHGPGTVEVATDAGLI